MLGGARCFVVEARRHVDRGQQKLASAGELQHGSNKAAGVGAEEAADPRHQRVGEQQAHSGLVVRRSRRVNYLVGRQPRAQQSRVTDLLQGDGVQLELGAACDDASELTRHAQANVEGAQPQRCGGVGREGMPWGNGHRGGGEKQREVKKKQQA